MRLTISITTRAREMNKNKKDSELPPSVVDVLVVGNGPVGATIAALLGRYGVTTLVLDMLHDIVLMPRAIALDNEALRIQLHSRTSKRSSKVGPTPVSVRQRLVLAGD
jgi:cation diffusion facilitator CzcD-associated flavoprotein CzcO